VKSIPLDYDLNSDEVLSAHALYATDTETGLKFGDRLNVNRVNIQTIPTYETPIGKLNVEDEGEAVEGHLLTRNKKTITIDDNDNFDLKIIPLNDKVEILKATESTTTEGERTSTIIHDELRSVNGNETTNVSINSIIKSNTFTKPSIDLSFFSPILFHVEPDSQVLRIDDFRIEEQTTIIDDSAVTDEIDITTENGPNETTVPEEIIKITTIKLTSTLPTNAPNKTINSQKEINKIKLNEKIAEIEAEPVILTQGV